MASSTVSVAAGGWIPLPEVEHALGRKLTSIEVVGGIYCSICHTTFSNKKDYDSHYVNHSIGDDVGYTCVVCRKEFTGYPSFRNHCYLAHVAKNKHKCIHCNKTFSKQSILNSHIDSMHKFKCTSCHQQFLSKKELHTHQIIHKTEKDKPPYQCHTCGQSIESIDKCEYHIEEHGFCLYSCPICNETAENKLEAAKHLTKHFGEVLSDEDISAPKLGEDCSVDILGGVLCNYCDDLFKNRLEFDTHFVTEHSDRELLYSCNICGKNFDKYSVFANHCYYHISKDRFECTDCKKTFPRLSLLVLHTEAFHGTDTVAKPFSCGECGYGFKSARRLCEHTRVVHDTCTMRCLHKGCLNTFESLRDLILHQRQHQTHYDNICQQCGLRFTTLASCERHLDVHRKKHYSCPVCNRAYHEKYLILKHIPSHFESVLHVCKVCGKFFNQRSRLVQHAKTHSDLRSHICSYCNKGFMKAEQLEQHVNIHTGSKPYKCTVCPKTFASYPNWHKHIRRMHNIDKIDKPTLKHGKDNVNKTTVPPQAPPITIIDNSDSNTKTESGIDSTSSEMSLETYIFFDMDDNTMDSIDPTIIEKDWCIMNDNENALLDNSVQYTDMLPVNNTTFDSEFPIESGIASPSSSGSCSVFREYGPELTGEEQYLPHIDPLLTIKPHHEHNHWEPLITKVYHAYDDTDNRLSIINTDIY